MSNHAGSHNGLRSYPQDAGRSVPVVLRNVPRGYDWAFYSREEPRMHIQTTPGRVVYKIWLEQNGRWSIDKCGDVPAKVFKVVKEALQSDPELAWRIRAQWVRQMIVKGWLTVRVAGDHAKLVAYPGTNHEFARDADLSKHAPPSFYDSQEDVRLDSETASLAVGMRRPEHEWVLIDLAVLLWTETSA